MTALRNKMLAQKIMATGVSYLNHAEVDLIVQVLTPDPAMADLIRDIRQYGINCVDKGEALAIMRALEK